MASPPPATPPSTAISAESAIALVARGVFTLAVAAGLAALAALAAVAAGLAALAALAAVAAGLAALAAPPLPPSPPGWPRLPPLPPRLPPLPPRSPPLPPCAPPPHSAQTHPHRAQHLAVCRLAATHPYSTLPLGSDLCASTKTRDGPVPVTTRTRTPASAVSSGESTPRRGRRLPAQRQPAGATPRARLGANRPRGANPTPTLGTTDPRPGFRRVVGVVKPPTKEAPLGADDGCPNTCRTTHLRTNGS